MSTLVKTEERPRFGVVDVAPMNFLQSEVGKLLAAENRRGVEWLHWKEAIEWTSNYNDEELMVFFSQATTHPSYYDIRTRGTSDVDLAEIPADETWGQFLRRVAARILQYELCFASGTEGDDSG